MLRHVGLHVQGGALRIDAQCQQLRHAREGALAQILGAVAGHGDGVLVGDEVKGLVVFLQLDKLLDCSQVVAQVALELGYHPLIVVVSSVVTGVFGGVLRDVLCDRVPLVFSEELYASIAILVAVMYMGMLHFNLDETIGTQLVIVICLIFAFGLRLLAIFYRISLPVFEYQEREYVRDPAGRLTMWALNKAGVQRREMRRRSVGAPKAPRTPKDKSGQKKRKRKHRFELVDRGEYEYGDERASQNPPEEPRNSDE